MKKSIIILIALLLLCACQPTPEKPTVMQKNFDRLIEQAKTTPDPKIGEDTVQAEAQPSAKKPDVATPTGLEATEAPKGEHIQETFTGKSDAFIVEIDADIEKTELPMPIVRVYPGDIDDAAAQRFFDVLTKGQKLYTEEGLNCKPYYDRQIAIVMEEISYMESIKDDPLFSQESLDDSKDYLRELQKKRKKAPDEPGAPVETVHLEYNVPTKYTDFTRGDFNCMSEDEQIRFNVCTNWKGVKSDAFSMRGAWITYQNHTSLIFDQKHIDRVSCGRVTGETTKTPDNPLTMTPREAEQKTAEIVGACGLTDLAPTATWLVYINTGDYGSPVRNHPENYVYGIEFSRLVKGVPVAHPASESFSGDEATPRPRWVYESLYIEIGNEGIVNFSYRAPLILENTLVESAALMPFSEIMDIFRKMTPVVYEYELTNSENLKRIEIKVDRITLSLQRVAEKDNIDSGLLIPVWNFWGELNYIYSESTWDWAQGASLLSINAVDGSIIDPKLGY